jgi:hypothetical protein
MNKKNNSGLCIAGVLASILICDFAEAAPVIKLKVDNNDVFYDKSINSLNFPSGNKPINGVSVWPEMPLQTGDAIGDMKDFGKPGVFWFLEDLRSLGNLGSPGYFSRPCNTLNVVPVPEPGIYVMLLAGFAMLGFVARRKNNPKS